MFLDQPLKKKVTSYEYYFSGYEWMFATKQDMLGNDLGKPVAQGIAIFVMLILCVPGLLFSKKSSFVALLTSLALITISILFFSISAAKESYTTISEGWGAYNKKEPGPKFTLMSWVPYVTGSLIFIVGALMSYRTYKVMKEEIKRPSQPKGPTYSYLHK